MGRKYGRNFGLKKSYFGQDTFGHDVKAFGDTTGKYMEWDASADKFTVAGTINATTLQVGAVALTATPAEINRAADVSARIVNVTTTPLAISEASHDGKIVTLNKADGLAITLPAATGSGLKTTFIVGTTVTSVGTTVAVTGNDMFTGTAIVAQDSADTAVMFETAANSNRITLNGTTTGGIKGDMVELIDIAADLWFVNIISSATSSEASPFSNV